MRWTAKVRAHYFPEWFQIFQHHRPRTLGMCGLLFPSWLSPSSLRLKGPAATVSLRPIFFIAGAFASSGFSYCLGSLRDNLIAIATTTAATSSLAAWSSGSTPTPTPPLSPSSFPFRFSLPCQLLPASSLSYPNPPLWTLPSCLSPGLLNQRLYMIKQ